MKSLIIYDNTGYSILQQMYGYYSPQGGIHYLEIEIPEGKQIKTINTSVTPHEVIFENIPKTQEELDRERISDLENSTAEMMNLIAMQQTPTN